MKDCLRSHSDDEARELRIGYLTMLLHTAKTEEKRREVLRQLEEMKKCAASRNIEEGCK